MEEDTRCCGSGTCIIDAQGQCWCGQRWDGEKMVAPSQQQMQPQPGNPAGTGPGPGPVVDPDVAAHP